MCFAGRYTREEIEETDVKVKEQKKPEQQE